MGSFVSGITGCLAFSLYTLNTLFWIVPILIISLFKLIPIKVIRTACTYLIDFSASSWISFNGIIEKIFHPVKINLECEQTLSKKEWYMVIANHQSWVDILILQRILNHRIPFLKFFLKQELIFVPVLGLAWWALDFPFMKRYSPSQLKKNPKLKGKDIEITKKACSKFKTKPVSVMNFVEGTRFNKNKHTKQASPFTHLLKPKAGGLAFALAAMGEQIHKLVDVTIHYPEGSPTYWEYISGKVKQVNVHIKVTDIDSKMRGDYSKDRQFKIDFQAELNKIWKRKDEQLTIMSQQETSNKEVR
ncbi:acyltransferase [uncultured Shewanella sp.]|uniref:acyltransferase n=1 Tax=uncultured Shewanella sp. TaxID=173975 RepID=UPI00260FF597|nr:acyltransferase [uncultured Shewanella sp.]